MSDIETDFQAVADQINAKIKEATEALKEANKIARSIGVEYYDEHSKNTYGVPSEQQKKNKQLAKLVDFDPVLIALDNAGWQTSTMTADC